MLNRHILRGHMSMPRSVLVYQILRKHVSFSRSRKDHVQALILPLGPYTDYVIVAIKELCDQL